MSHDHRQTVALSVETSGPRGSVLIARGGDVLATDTFKVEQQHGVQLLPTVDALTKKAGLQPTDVEAVYVSGGPGSFTGLRIGITFAKAIAFALNCRVVRVPSLDVLAQNALAIDPQPKRVVAMLDAKRGNIFANTYELREGMYAPLDAPAEREPSKYLTAQASATVVGMGVVKHRPTVNQVAGITVAGEDFDHGQAEWVLKLGAQMAEKNQFICLDELIPIYIRKPDAEEKWEARQLDQAGG